MLCFDDAHESAHELGLPVLSATDTAATVFAVSEWVGRESRIGDVYGKQRYMSAENLREWVHLGHEVGSHTATHAALTYLENREVERELDTSKKHLEDMTGAAVTSVSFPNGCWDLRTWNIARRLGYRCATVARGVPPTRSGLLRVTPAQNFDTADDLVGKLLGTDSVASARGRVMEQFARGTPLWQFRRAYRIGRK